MFGIVRVTQAFLALLESSAHPVIVNVSSGMGSLAVTTDPSRFESTVNSLAYPASKTAVNMLTSQYAKAFPTMRINAVDPGYTATDFNQHRGTKSVGFRAPRSSSGWPIWTGRTNGGVRRRERRSALVIPVRRGAP